jgi:hypothetical protein
MSTSGIRPACEDTRPHRRQCRIGSGRRSQSARLVCRPSKGPFFWGGPWRRRSQTNPKSNRDLTDRDGGYRDPWEVDRKDASFSNKIAGIDPATVRFNGPRTEGQPETQARSVGTSCSKSNSSFGSPPGSPPPVSMRAAPRVSRDRRGNGEHHPLASEHLHRQI